MSHLEDLTEEVVDLRKDVLRLRRALEIIESNMRNHEGADSFESTIHKIAKVALDKGAV